MKTKIKIVSGILISLFLLLTPAFAQKHIVLNSFNVNIRTGPSIDHYIVCTAGKGEIFILVDKQGEWVEIKMFSDDSRFIHRDMVYFLNEFVPGHNMELPDKSSVIALQDVIKWAKIVSANEAEEIIPASVSKERYNNFKNICLDKNLHTLFEKQGVQIALYQKIIPENTE